MISPPGWGGIAFSEASDANIRAEESRAHLAKRLGIDNEWATVHQVHGSTALEVASPGRAGEADALWTPVKGLPVAVFTADCFGVVVQSRSAVGVAHAGWKGAASGVLRQLLGEMITSGHYPLRVAIGPGIGPCCFEVGPEVVAKFPGFEAETTWGTSSVDLPLFLRSEVPDNVEVWVADRCTRHEDNWFSHRGTGTKARMVSVGWN